MIEKIVSISNVGTFVDYKPSPKYKWDGKFSKVNLIYAPNGSGKTTLSTIFNSLTNITPELISLKQTINSKELPNVKLKFENVSGLTEYNGKKWSNSVSNILVFDIHFIEDYLFLSSISNEKNIKKLMMLVLGAQGTSLRNRYFRLRKKQHNFEKQLNALKEKKNNNHFSVISDNLKQNIEAQKSLIELYSEYALPIFDNYVQLTNNYLSRFTNNIRIQYLYTPSKKFQESIFNPNLIVEIHGKALRFKLPDFSKKEGNVKFTLSEGDKNAIALSFFLANAEIKGISDKVIIFDDPLSSFDHLRKTSTVNLLSRIAQNSKQFILNTHDINFAKAVKDKLSFTTVLNLKIEKDTTTSFITQHDIDFETLSGYQKDILTIKNYKDIPLKTEEEKRKVIRCIRPILETIIKVKYYNEFSYNEWLGGIIEKIRNSSSSSKLSQLKSVLPHLIDLNDYTKKYHHSEFDNEIINDSELDFFITLMETCILKI